MMDGICNSVGDPDGGWSAVFPLKTFATGYPKTELAVYGISCSFADSHL
jgi:hypothetical protein